MFKDACMQKLCFAIFSCCVFACNNPNTEQISTTNKPDDVGKIEIYDKNASTLIDSNERIEIVGSHYLWSEGPVWVASKQMLLFSDVRANTIFSWKMKDTPVAYLTPSGYTDTAIRNGENGSNGLALDKNGRLLLCQSGNR
jgi:gluconolactonase